MLECVINVSEGRDRALIAEIAAGADDCLLDVHSDGFHHRSVLTLGGERVESAARGVATAAIELLDLTTHRGVHPRLGVLDVVPFVPIPPETSLTAALAARDEFATWLAGLGVPVFLYGPERSLPDVRRSAFVTLQPDKGPPSPHPTAGACCVGARPVLVAYNLWLSAGPIEARAIARDLRRPGVRTLGLDLAGHGQVSCNLVDPFRVGPETVYDFVAERARIERAELVGLLPVGILERIPRARYAELDLSEDRTIEARLASART